jgi:hypothetical protein
MYEAYGFCEPLMVEFKGLNKVEAFSTLPPALFMPKFLLSKLVSRVPTPE